MLSSDAIEVYTAEPNLLDIKNLTRYTTSHKMTEDIYEKSQTIIFHKKHYGEIGNRRQFITHHGAGHLEFNFYLGCKVYEFEHFFDMMQLANYLDTTSYGYLLFCEFSSSSIRYCVCIKEK